MLDTFLGIGFFISFCGISYFAYLSALYWDYKLHNPFVEEEGFFEFCEKEVKFHLGYIKQFFCFKRR